MPGLQSCPRRSFPNSEQTPIFPVETSPRRLSNWKHLDGLVISQCRAKRKVIEKAQEAAKMVISFILIQNRQYVNPAGLLPLGPSAPHLPQPR